METKPIEVGIVKEVKNFLINVDGFPSIRLNDVVENESGVKGYVSSLGRDRVEVLLLNEGSVMPKDVFKETGVKLSVPVGDFLIGRVINPLGVPLDTRGPLSNTPITDFRELDPPSPPLNDRAFIDDQFISGFTLVDQLIPIGKGQRELVVGDARSGMGDFLIDTVVNQKDTGVLCIYAAVGKTVVEVKSLTEKLSQSGALSHTIVVTATSSDLPPLVFLAPQSALSIAEHFQSQGKDVLVILDDLAKHAKMYREMSLLGNKSPGRESYPGDVFYQHSHLMERAGRFAQTVGGGSITLLPVIELTANDLTTFIPTNVMSMTDGHILFKASMYTQGQRPAIDLTLSVSRVGQQTQKRIQNLLTTRIKQLLAQAIQLEAISRFSVDLPEETQKVLKQKQLIDELIKQDIRSFVPIEVQVVLMTLPFTNFVQQDNLDFVKKYKKELVNILFTHPLLSSITKGVLEFKSEDDLFKQVEQVVNLLQGSINEARSHDKPADQAPPAPNANQSEANTSNPTTPPPSSNQEGK